MLNENNPRENSVSAIRPLRLERTLDGGGVPVVFS